MKKRRSRHRFKKIPCVQPTSRSATQQPVLSLDNTVPPLTPPVQPQRIRVRSTAEYHASESADSPGPLNCMDIEVLEDELVASDDPVHDVSQSDIETRETSVEDMDHDCILPNDSESVCLEESNDRTTEVEIQTWQALWGVIMTSGNRKMTKNHYQSMRTVADAFGRMGLLSWTARTPDAGTEEYFRRRITSLPHFTTIQRKIKPMLVKTLAPRGKNFTVDVDMRKAGARSSKYSSQGNPQTQVRVIFPSEYAMADMATGPVFDAICSTSLEHTVPAGQRSSTVPAVSVSECVDIWPIVSSRSWFYGTSSSISVDNSSSSQTHSSFAEKGDVVRVSLIGSHAINNTLKDGFEVCRGESDYVQVQGTILHIWNVHHKSRKGIPGFEEDNTSHLSIREREIVHYFNFVSYTSPSDSVTVEIPDLPVQNEEDGSTRLQTDGNRRRNIASPELQDLQKKRRAVLKEKKRQSELAWREWKKPIIKPGDVVTLLRPFALSDFSSDSTSEVEEYLSTPLSDNNLYLCLVNRFWTENEEQNRHLFWVAPDVEFDAEGGSGADFEIRQRCCPLDAMKFEFSRDVHSVDLVGQHCGRRGPENSTPVSSTGTLPNGEKYLIYRFLLFWDGFEMSDGNSASGEGFYMLCLNLPVQARTSASAVRVLSLTPPGVKSATILQRIQEDIVTGMTDGYQDYDANGERRRIFLDLVGFIGDTPALNASLDVLGHTANAFCHLCRFRRQSATVIGSRYAQTGLHGSHTCSARSFYSHSAVRDSKAKAETCRLLGIRPGDDSDLPIHALRAAMHAAKHKIPKTLSGMPILSGDIDPYRSCLVAPDHLLTGHSRDCINLAFKMLPSKNHRALCEQFMLGFLRDCRLPGQNRIFDHNSKRLHTMSMTDMYALTLVAEKGLLAGCAKAGGADPMASAHSRLGLAIQLVASCANLVAEVWYLPDANRDGELSVRSFNCHHGGKNLFRLKRLALAHISKLEQVCAVPDADVNDLHSNNIDKDRKQQVMKDISLALMAIKTVDKPNVHRLLELFETTLPMIGHVGRIGELVLEKAHQPLKRTIKRSNNKNSHILAIENISVSDWQGRLTVLLLDALRGENLALLGCFRLLAGREAVASIHAILKQEHISQVLSALGPEICVPAELLSQSQTVISLRRDSYSNISWTLQGNVQTVEIGFADGTGYRQQVLEILSAGYNFGLEAPTVEFGDILNSKLENGLTRHPIQTGDFIEALCCNPTNLEFHCPFAVQPTHLHPSTDLVVQSGRLFWYVCALFRLRLTCGRVKVQAAAYPCQALPCTMRNGETVTKYKIRTLLSILTIEPYTRPVAVLHDCQSADCSPCAGENSIVHDPLASPMEGGTFFILSRREGFPTRQG